MSEGNLEPDEKGCFIISPIGKKGSPEYIHFLKVRDHIIDKVAKEKKGYKTLRSDDISEPGTITIQIIKQLREADLVIADLSRNNPNVFYELAIRHAVRKPVILISDETGNLPFDVQPLRVLKYSIDLNEIEESRRKLSDFIDAAESPNYQPTSPVTEALITPADDISTSMQDYFEIILDKISSIARSQAPLVYELVKARPVPPILPRSRGLDYQLRSLGVDVIERSPDELSRYEGVSGIALDHFSFIEKVQVNILTGVVWVNYDPVSEKYWLWEHGDESVWYYWDKSLDKVVRRKDITYARDR